MGRWPLKMTRSKQESTATIKLVNLATKRDSVFMASSSGWGPQQTPFWREDAVLAHPFWLRLRRVREGGADRLAPQGFHDCRGVVPCLPRMGSSSLRLAQAAGQGGMAKPGRPVSDRARQPPIPFRLG